MATETKKQYTSPQLGFKAKRWLIHSEKDTDTDALNLQYQIQNLRQTHDLLLRLLSGQISLWEN